MSEITHAEIHQFFSRLTPNTSPITSTTNFKVLVGSYPQFPSFLVPKSGVTSGEMTVTPGSGETHAERTSHWNNDRRFLAKR